MQSAELRTPDLMDLSDAPPALCQAASYAVRAVLAALVVAGVIYGMTPREEAPTVRTAVTLFASR